MTLGASELKDIARDYVRDEYDADDYSKATVEVQDMARGDDAALLEVTGRFKNGWLSGDSVRLVLTIDPDDGTVLAESSGRLADAGGGGPEDPLEGLSELGDAWKTANNVLSGDIVSNPKCPSCGTRNTEELSEDTHQCISCGQRFTDDGTGIDLF